MLGNECIQRFPGVPNVRLPETENNSHENTLVVFLKLIRAVYFFLCVCFYERAS